MTPARVPQWPCIGQGQRLARAGRVLVDGDQARDALAVDELAAHQVSGALGATIAMVTSPGGLIKSKWMLSP